MRRHQLKIMSPIDRPEEALPLIKAGADEFYCGVLIGNESLASVRPWGIEGSNLADFDSLEKLTAIVKENQKKIFLALNSMVVKPSHLRLIGENMEKIKKIGIDGLIISNVETFHQLRNCGLELVASSFFEAKNSETVEFLIQEFGVKRVILDRQITVADLENIRRKFPAVEFEAFAMNSGCRSLASACRQGLVSREKIKDNKKPLSPFPIPGNCQIHLCQSLFSIDEEKKIKFLSSDDKRIIARRLNMPYPTCGACALFYFKEYGINAVKIVGRGQPLERKILITGFLRRALDSLDISSSREDFYSKSRVLFEKFFGRKCHQACCYYPHFFDAKDF